VKIIGIDPGTGITGFGVIEAGKDSYRLIDAGVIRTPANSPLPARLDTIFQHLEEIIAEHGPDAMAVEKIFFSQNVTTAISVSHARGVVLLVGQRAGMPISEYTPLQIKQALTGYGRAEKSQVQQMVKTMLKLKETPKPDDCADAIAAAICHAMTV